MTNILPEPRDISPRRSRGLISRGEGCIFVLYYGNLILQRHRRGCVYSQDMYIDSWNIQDILYIPGGQYTGFLSLSHESFINN